MDRNIKLDYQANSMINNHLFDDSNLYQFQQTSHHYNQTNQWDQQQQGWGNEQQQGWGNEQQQGWSNEQQQGWSNEYENKKQRDDQKIDQVIDNSKCMTIEDKDIHQNHENLGFTKEYLEEQNRKQQNKQKLLENRRFKEGDMHDIQDLELKKNNGKGRVYKEDIESEKQEKRMLMRYVNKYEEKDVRYRIGNIGQTQTKNIMDQEKGVGDRESRSRRVEITEQQMMIFRRIDEFDRILLAQQQIVQPKILRMEVSYDKFQQMRNLSQSIQIQLISQNIDNFYTSNYKNDCNMEYYYRDQEIDQKRYQRLVSFVKQLKIYRLLNCKIVGQNRMVDLDQIRINEYQNYMNFEVALKICGINDLIETQCQSRQYIGQQQKQDILDMDFIKL